MTVKEFGRLNILSAKVCFDVTKCEKEYEIFDNKLDLCHTQVVSVSTVIKTCARTFLFVEQLARTLSISKRSNTIPFSITKLTKNMKFNINKYAIN